MSQSYSKKISITEDGEIVKEGVVKLYSPFRNDKGYNFKYKSTMTKSYLEISLPCKSEENPNGFTDTEIGKIYRLSKHIYSNSNLLAKRSNNEIRPIAKDEVQEIVNLHRTKFNPFWNKVLEHKVVKEIDVGGSKFFCFNPLYFNSTTYMPLYLYIEFQEELNAHLPKWVIEKYLEMQEKENKKKIERR